MNFHFNELIIWLRNGKIRKIHFLPNKVNIVTGRSDTGKTSILQIIEYCLFASEHRIPESMINENARWYGIRITIGEKTYTISRKAPSQGKESSEYWFSSVGEVPSVPTANISEKALKQLMGSEFSLDQDTTIQYGGKTMRAGSKVSLKYFLLFNTISQDIITHTEQFFDKQNDDRYREALPRTFDLAVGIDTVENILKREKRSELERKLRKLQNVGLTRTKQQSIFHTELSDTVRQAKEYLLIPPDKDVEPSIALLRGMIKSDNAGKIGESERRYEETSAKINRLARKIRKLRTFEKEYEVYRAGLKLTSDSLKATDYLARHSSELLQTSIFFEIMEALQDDHKKIKEVLKTHAPLQSNTGELVKSFEAEKSILEEALVSEPREVRSFNRERDKNIFLGEVKAKIELYADDDTEVDLQDASEIEGIEDELADLWVAPVEDRRTMFISVLDETVGGYVELAKNALGAYGQYKSAFDYKNKKLHLRKPKSQLIENVGSSSNHMFLHLFLFLGLHELILSSNAQHVAPFLIIDQFTRPYWADNKGEEETIKHSDVSKVKVALRLLDGFISAANEKGKSFQMIVFEHIGEEYWEGSENIHLVETFDGGDDGNALIPPVMLKS